MHSARPLKAWLQGAHYEYEHERKRRIFVQLRLVELCVRSGLGFDAQTGT